jgi:hypothetical protein
MGLLVRILVAIALLLVSQPASAQVLSGGLGAGLLTTHRGGESLAKFSAGPSLDLGVGWDVRPDVLVFGRLLVTSGIEDEQHAHDDVVIGATIRAQNTKFSGEVGPGLGFYRGRYRYMSFFSSDSAYDGDVLTPTLIFGGGVTLYRTGDVAIDAHVNVTASFFGGEIALVTVAHLFVGASWQR